MRIMDDAMKAAEVWQARAAAWELAAFGLRYPDAELVDAIVSGEWVDAACEIAVALGIVLPEGFGGHSAVGVGACDAFDIGASGNIERPDVFLHALRTEATRLFVGAPEPVCNPYEGVWRAIDDGVQALLFVNPHSVEVERFMRSCGLGRPDGTNEPLDHLATECELMEYLAACAAGICKPTVPATDLPGGSPEKAYTSFLEEHARAWMPRFAERLAAESSVPFYRDVAACLGALVGS